MSVDPFVHTRIEDVPRQEQNLAPGVHRPPARPWFADRPGDLRGRQPEGPMLGAPGPNIGYALSLVARARDRIALAPYEHGADAEAVIGELAMKRAASFGRAPVITDVDVAMLLLGYQGGIDPEDAKWRVGAVEGAHESYSRRRALCDAVDIDVLRMAPSAIVPQVTELRAAVRATATSG
ncbi:MAG: hypothetical protein FJW86_07180 [Actinobacteria bacterium]|nr:hypothetical protein [Actinomycetota bacterium]